MSDPRYDFDKENDKDFLRAAGKLLQEKVIELQILSSQLIIAKQIDEEIKQKLTGELLLLRKYIFDSRQEKKEKTKDLKKKKKKKGITLIHNENENKKVLTSSQNNDSTLTDEEVIHELESKVCPNCGKNKIEEISGAFEESSEIDVNTTYYILKRHKRKKYKCSCCNSIVAAKGPDKLVEGGAFSLQMAAQVVCDKFEFHIPLERQRVKMKNAGLNVSVKTLFSLTEHLYNLLSPLNKMNRKDIIEGKYTCLDESPICFFNKNKSKGYVWSMSNNIGAYYQFEPTRSGSVAREMLQGFYGVVITDGYKGYDFLSKTKEIVHAYCWAHLRRYFFDAMSENKDAAIVVDYIDKLYEIEHEAQNLDDLLYLRRTRSNKIYKDIESWVDENEFHYLSSALTCKAINYFYNQKEGLKKFLDNKFVPLDNNSAERRQRCPVMGRKNFKFFRSIDGADIGMFFYSIIESCKTNGLNAFSYLLEMAMKKINNEEFITPYRYATNLREKIVSNLNNELSFLTSKDSS